MDIENKRETAYLGLETKSDKHGAFSVLEFLSSRCNTLSTKWSNLTPEGRAFYTNLAILGGYLIGDVVTTHAFLSSSAQEMHPFMAKVLQTYGEAGLYTVRLGEGVTFMPLFEVARRMSGFKKINYVLRSFNSFYFLVMLNNLASVKL